MSGVDAAYVSIMGAAVTAGVLARRIVARRVSDAAVGLTRVQRVALFLGVLIGGALGAKLPYVLADPDGAVSGLAWLRDGRTITWGLAFGYLGVELAKWLSGVRVKTGDGFAVPVAVSIGIGRLGCFYAGCCYGAETTLPWGVDFGDGVTRHPNQLYEVAFHLAMAVVLYRIARRGLLPRQRVKLYLITYMCFRFFAELWRPEERIALSLTFYQLSALAFAALFALLWWCDARAARLEAQPATS